MSVVRQVQDAITRSWREVEVDLTVWFLINCGQVSQRGLPHGVVPRGFGVWPSFDLTR